MLTFLNFKQERVMNSKLMELSRRAITEHGYQISHEIAEIARAPQSEWVSVDEWKKEDCDPVWVWYSQLTSLGMFTGSDKAYWNKGMCRWDGFGLDNVFSHGASVRYVQPLPTPPAKD